jgi:hypothetical protein
MVAAVGRINGVSALSGHLDTFVHLRAASQQIRYRHPHSDAVRHLFDNHRVGTSATSDAISMPFEHETRTQEYDRERC